MTLRDKPLAEPQPLGAKTGSERRREELEQIMREIDDLARSIARAWRSPRTATELIKEQRR